MNEFMLIFGMAIVTFLIRYPVLAFIGKMNLPDKFTDSLRYVPPAVLTAIIIPELFLTEGKVDLSLNNAALFAGLIAAIISWRSKNLLLTIVIGMAAFLGWRWLMIFY